MTVTNPMDANPWHLLGGLQATLEAVGAITVSDWNRAVEAAVEFQQVSK